MTIMPVEHITDSVGAAFSALWARSAAGQEVARLREAGHKPGERCELAFVFSFGEGEGDAARKSLAEAGFKVADVTSAARGFYTVTVPATLGRYAIARTAARVNRVARRHDGHAEVIGLVGEVARRYEFTGPHRNPNRVAHRARSVA
jgi:hypothetical protein